MLCGNGNWAVSLFKSCNELRLTSTEHWPMFEASKQWNHMGLPRSGPHGAGPSPAATNRSEKLDPKATDLGWPVPRTSDMKRPPQSAQDSQWVESVRHMVLKSWTLGEGRRRGNMEVSTYLAFQRCGENTSPPHSNLPGTYPYSYTIWISFWIF